MARNPMTPFRPGGGMFPGDPFLSLHREMNRLFDDVFRGAALPAAWDPGPRRVSNFVNASMNVSETENEIRLTAELPGVTEQDIDISLDDDVLTIRGRRSSSARTTRRTSTSSNAPTAPSSARCGCPSPWIRSRCKPASRMGCSR